MVTEVRAQSFAADLNASVLLDTRRVRLRRKARFDENAAIVSERSERLDLLIERSSHAGAGPSGEPRVGT